MTVPLGKVKLLISTEIFGTRFPIGYNLFDSLTTMSRYSNKWINIYCYFDCDLLILDTYILRYKACSHLSKWSDNERVHGHSHGLQARTATKKWQLVKSVRSYSLRQRVEIEVGSCKIKWRMWVLFPALPVCTGATWFRMNGAILLCAAAQHHCVTLQNSQIRFLLSKYTANRPYAEKFGPSVTLCDNKCHLLFLLGEQRKTWKKLN